MIGADIAFLLACGYGLAGNLFAHVAQAGVEHANDAFHVVAAVQRLLDRTGWNACKGLANGRRAAIVFNKCVIDAIGGLPFLLVGIK